MSRPYSVLGECDESKHSPVNHLLNGRQPKILPASKKISFSQMRKRMISSACTTNTLRVILPLVNLNDCSEVCRNFFPPIVLNFNMTKRKAGRKIWCSVLNRRVGDFKKDVEFCRRRQVFIRFLPATLFKSEITGCCDLLSFSSLGLLPLERRRIQIIP